MRIARVEAQKARAVQVDAVEVLVVGVFALLARLAVAVRDAAVGDCHTLDSARKIDRPGDPVRVGTADALDVRADDVGENQDDIRAGRLRLSVYGQ